MSNKCVVRDRRDEVHIGKQKFQVGTHNRQMSSSCWFNYIINISLKISKLDSLFAALLIVIHTEKKIA